MTYTIGITPPGGGTAVEYTGTDIASARKALAKATPESAALYARASNGNRSIDLASDGAYPVETIISELNAWLDECE